MLTKQSVMVFGTFDVLHPGHLWFLKAASSFGQLNVVLTPDKMCKKYKKKFPHNNFGRRAKRLESITYVRRVVPADIESGSFGVVSRWRPHIIVLGYDQKDLREILDKWTRDKMPSIKLSRCGPYRPHLYKSSFFRLLAEKTHSMATN